MTNHRPTPENALGTAHLHQPCAILPRLACKIGSNRLGCWERKDTPELYRFAPTSQLPCCVAAPRSRLMAALRRQCSPPWSFGASALEGASREDAARQAGMDRQIVRARRGLLAASPPEVGAKVF